MPVDSNMISSINYRLSHPGIKARIRKLRPGWLWTISGTVLVIGTIQVGRAPLGHGEVQSIISAILASFIAILALGALVVTLLWPQYNNAIDRMQDLLKVFAGIVFEVQEDKIRALEFLPLALQRLEHADETVIDSIWGRKYRNVDSVALQLLRYIYSLSWYEIPIPIDYFKSELEKSSKFKHLVSQVDLEVTMKSIGIRLRPEILLEIQLELFNPANYVFHMIDGEFPSDLSNTLYYKMLVSGFVNLRLRVQSYLTLTCRKAYILYAFIITELISLICGLLAELADHVWFTKTLVIGFMVLATIIIVTLVKLVLPNYKQVSTLN